MLTRKKIAVLRGGPSPEYEVSLRTGAEILEALSSDKYEVFDVAITRGGEWYLNGAKMAPADVLSKADLVFNALHGAYGEDGKIQRILETFKIPYTGSRSLPSALAMNKILAKREFKKIGLKIPLDVVLEKNNFDAAEIFKTFPMPAIIKPANAGSSLGISIVGTGADLEKAARNAFEISDRVLVEEYIAGREATCGVIDNFRNKGIYSLIPIEIRPKSENNFFDYDAKYSGQTEEICPGNFTEEEKNKLQNLARQAHQALGLRHYSRSDFIVSPRRGIYLLETNSLPGLTQNSLLPISLKAVGSDLPEFVEHIIGLTLETDS
ncbi:MAG: D-alanine--D-alanine ligase [Candidatus Pacebacteria bacterium]|nr:D-alanine--D-alanine ligase [Candidatus Paceibacterota bacterium]